MATRRFIGNAAPVADVWTATIGGTLEVGDVFQVTINNKTWSYSAMSTVIADVRTAMITAFNAIDQTIYPEFKEVVASASLIAGAILFTGSQLPGRPTTMSFATTEAGGGAADGQTFTGSNTTPATGPEWWSNALNWAEGSVPVSGDDVIIEDSRVNIRYGLNQSAVTLATLKIGSNYSGEIGLPKVNPKGYAEYREQYLRIGVTSCDVGYGNSGSGPAMFKLDTGSVQTSVTIRTTGGSGGTFTGGSTSTPAFLFKGTHADNAITLNGGTSGICYYTGEVATVKTLRVDQSESGQTSLIIGSGGTLNGTGATFVQSGGNVYSQSSFRDVVREDGNLWLQGAAGAVTLQNRGGTLNYESTGTIGLLDNVARVVRQDTLATGTITNANFYNGCSFDDRNATIVFTNPWQAVQAKITSMRLDFGSNRKYQVTT